MRTLTATWLGALGALALVGACSAIVREVEVTCENDCKALNDHYGLGDDACFIYQCRADQKGCEKRARDKDGDGVADAVTCADAGVEGDRELDCDDSNDARVPGASEECNAEDDDCDGVIDEGALDGSFAAESKLRFNAPPESITFGASADGLLDLALRLPGDTSYDLRMRAADYVEAPIDNQCQVKKEETITACAIEEVAIASTAKATIVAGVNLNLCSTGQVRLGASFDRESFSWQHAPGSSLRLGVDSRRRDSGFECDPWGVSRLSAALLERAGMSQGLLLWREIDPTADAIKPAPLRGLAFDLTSDPAGLLVLTPQGERSERVTQAGGLERAALVSWPAAGTGGFFMAFDAPDAIEIAFLPRSPASSALSERLQRGMSIPTHAPRHIALALDPGADASAALGLGVAWHDGSALQFAPITYDAKADVVLRAGDIVPVADAAQLLDGPVLAYQRDGFRTAEDAVPGGWYVLWLEQGTRGTRLRGTRVAQANFAVEEPFLVSEGARPGTLFAYPHKGPQQLAYLSDEEQPELYIGSLGCEPRP